MAKNYLLIYSEQLATEIELLCQNIKAPSIVGWRKRNRMSTNLDTFCSFLPPFRHLFTRLRQQKTHVCLPTKVRFLNDVCLRQMMTASP